MPQKSPEAPVSGQTHLGPWQRLSPDTCRGVPVSQGTVLDKRDRKGLVGCEWGPVSWEGLVVTAGPQQCPEIPAFLRNVQKAQINGSYLGNGVHL